MSTPMNRPRRTVTAAACPVAELHWKEQFSRFMGEGKSNTCAIEHGCSPLLHFYWRGVRGVKRPSEDCRLERLPTTTAPTHPLFLWRLRLQLAKELEALIDPATRGD